MTSFLRGFLLIAVLGAGVLYAAQTLENGGNLPLLSDAQEAQIGSLLSGLPTQPDEIQTTTQRATETAATISARSKEVSKHAENVLGAYVQPVSSEGSIANGDNAEGDADTESANDAGETTTASGGPSSQALHERALEYAQYQYCKGVVEAWEREN